MSKTNLAPDPMINEEGNMDNVEMDEEEIDELELKTDTKAGKEKSKNKSSKKEEGVLISKSKLAIARSLLVNIKENNDKLTELLTGFISPEEEARIGIGQASDDTFIAATEQLESVGNIIEGVFDGENMIGPDGKQYSVPANYASKSKLVEGDILKLTITPNGTFVYKQIGPIERRRLIGVLEQTPNGNYAAVAEGRKYRLLTASVTYFKGHAGDEAVLLVPKSGETKWAAVENIVRKAN